MSRIQELIRNKIFMGWFVVTFGGIGVFLASKSYMNQVKLSKFGELDDTDYKAGAYEGPPTADRVSKYEGGGGSKMSRVRGDVLPLFGMFSSYGAKAKSSSDDKSQ